MKPIRTLVLLLILLGLSMLPAAAQETTDREDTGPEGTELTEDAAVMLALRSNLGLQAEERSLSTAQRDRGRAWNQLLPSLQGSATMSRSNTEQTFSSLVPAGPPVPGTDNVFGQVQSVEEEAPQWSLSTSLSAQLNLSLRLYYAVQQTAVAVREGRLSLADAEDRIRRDVRKQFQQLRILEESVALTEARLETAQQQVQQARVNVENGITDRSVLLQAQIQEANLQVALQEQRNGLAAARRGFKNTLGLDLEEDLSLAGPAWRDMPSLDREALEDSFLDRRRELQSLQVQVDRLQNLQKLERAGLFPSISLGFTVDPAFQGDPFEDSWFNDLENDWSQQRGAFSVSIAQPLDPLLPGSSTWTSIANYRDQIAGLRLQMEQVRRGARLETASLFETMESARTTLRARELNLELARRNLQLARQGLESGNRGELEVLQAEDALQEAELNRDRQYNTYYGALVDLAYALNTTVDEVLEVGASR